MLNKKYARHTTLITAVFATTVMLSVASVSHAQGFYKKPVYYAYTYTPIKYSSDKRQVRGKAKVTALCARDRALSNCKWHTSVERSSWRGYQTVSGSILNNKSGWQYPRGFMYTGTYNYKSHFDGRSDWKTRCYNSVAKGWYACTRKGRWTANSKSARLTR